MKKVFLFVLSLLLFSLLFFLNKGEKESGLDLHQKGESFIEGLKIINKKNGSREWILTAKRADISENGEKARLSDIEMIIENGGITLYADKGLYSLAGKDLTVDGRIVAVSDKYSITSQQVRFDSTTGNLKADGGVKIEGKKFSIRGKGMDVDNIDQKVRIRKNVEAVFYN